MGLKSNNFLRWIYTNVRDSLRGLNAKQEQKIEVFAEIIDISKSQAATMLLRRGIAGLPIISDKVYLLPDLEVKNCERVGDNLVRLELTNGRVFFGHRSEQKQYLLYNAFKKYIAPEVNGDAYKLALDVQRRYSNVKRPWYFPDNGIYIEGGAILESRQSQSYCQIWCTGLIRRRFCYRHSL